MEADMLDIANARTATPNYPDAKARRDPVDGGTAKTTASQPQQAAAKNSLEENCAAHVEAEAVLPASSARSPAPVRDPRGKGSEPL